jgi:hypothetical protein
MRGRYIRAFAGLVLGWFAIVGLCSFSVSAFAQTRQACAEHSLVVQRLADKYGETLRSMGLHQNTDLIEVYASDETGTWTILITKPNGQACLLAAGQMWEANVPPTVKPGKDT